MNDIFILPLTNSEQIVLIDSCNASRLLQSKYFLEITGVINRTKKHQGKTISLANCIKQKFNKVLYDHKNRLSWDNRDINLRLASYSQNQANRTKYKLNAASKYKGVKFYTRTGKWQAAIQFNGIRFHLGTFIKEEYAALAYNKKAIELHGKFAVLNNI